jgi:methyl-accepting chemotaxis protein
MNLRVFSLSRTQIVLLCLGVIGGVALTTLSLAGYRQSMMEEREQKLRGMVENVYNLVERYHTKVQTAGLKESEAKNLAFQAIRQIPFDVNGYCWINDMNGVMVMHPIMPELDGEDLLEYKDPNGKYLFKEFISTVKSKNSGFVSYMWPKPDMPQATSYPKLSYVKGFAPWGWIIGSGIYIDDVDNAFRHAIYVTGGLVAATMIFLFALVLTMSESFRKP